MKMRQNISSGDEIGGHVLVLRDEPPAVIEKAINTLKSRIVQEIEGQGFTVSHTTVERLLIFAGQSDEPWEKAHWDISVISIASGSESQT